MLLYFFTLQLLGYRIFRWLFNFTISWLFNFTKFWWYKVTYYSPFGYIRIAHSEKFRCPWFFTPTGNEIHAHHHGLSCRRPRAQPRPYPVLRRRIGKRSPRFYQYVTKQAELCPITTLYSTRKYSLKYILFSK